MNDPILIVGGGIGGLCAAVALAKVGQPVRVLEQSNSFSEAGAGIQVGPNAWRLLQGLGLEELISVFAAVPQGIRIYDGLNGELLNTVHLGQRSEQRYGAPRIVIRRAHLQKCLLETAWTQADLEITTGFKVTDCKSLDRGVEAIDTSGVSVRGRAVIGADGLQSTLRECVEETRPETIGMTAWRTAIRASDAPESLRQPYIGVWMGPYCHLVHYPVDAGAEVDIMAIIEDTYHYDGWGAPGETEDLLPFFSDWHKSTYQILERLSDWTKWTLFTMKPLKAWGHGRFTLLGDAAHPVQPFLAQGSAMAIEDAAVLADEIHKSPDEIPAALRRYEQLRAPRAARVQNASERLGYVYHLAGLFRWARNFAIRRREPDALLARYDWLYGFTPDLTVTRQRAT